MVLRFDCGEAECKQLSKLVKYHQLMISVKKKSLCDLCYFGLNLQGDCDKKALALQSTGEECSRQRGWVGNELGVL